MTTQIPLFHSLAPTGEYLKSAGAAQVLGNNEEYKALFFAEADWLLRMQGTVTAEEVVGRIGMPKGHPNAIGAATRAFAAQHGLVVSGYRKSSRPTRHAGLVAVWAKA